MSYLAQYLCSGIEILTSEKSGVAISLMVSELSRPI